MNIRDAYLSDGLAAIILFNAVFLLISGGIFAFNGSDKWFSRMALAVILSGVAHIIAKLEIITEQNNEKE